MTDHIMQSWSAAEFRAGAHLARGSDVLRLQAETGPHPRRLLAEFRCRGLVEARRGIEECDRHLVGISFPANHLREFSRFGEVITWMAPVGAFHPNIKAPFCCIGPIAPGTGLVPILLQLYQMITWQRFTPREDDALNPAACRWARANMHRFPVDDRRSLLVAAEIDRRAQDGEVHDAS